jgi:FlaA1/EpsC-like NDP-sugar epimerase
MPAQGPPKFLSRFDRVTLSLVLDVAMAALSFVAALYLRLGDAFAEFPDELIVGGTLTFALAALIAFKITGLPRVVWRYVSLDDMALIARATTLAILLFVPAMFLWSRLADMPRAAIFINWFVLFALLVGPRLVYRGVREGSIDLRFGGPRADQVQVLLVGANDGAELFLQANRRRRRAPYYVVGILDDATRRQGRRMGGVEVLGGTEALEAVVAGLRARGLRPQRLVVTTPQLDREALGRLVDAADRSGMTAVRLPRINALGARSAADADIETAPIAIEDILGRPQTVLDRDAMEKLVRGRRVLVTGAGGSIGSELVRQIAARGPAELVLLDNAEFALYAIDREVEEGWPGLKRAATIGDVRDRVRLDRLMAERRPEIVFHAAALKHVPLLESNPAEGVLTNAVGTRNVADAAVAARVATFVLISTDKAVNPTNVLGASKRVAEMLCQTLDSAGGGTRFVTVRFGNVLGSSGSVVPLFQRQLAAGGPITVTHPDVERYFMTIREAVELVLQASVLAGSDEERGGILVLEMGEPVRIQDMARRMIRLAGKRPDIDVQIAYSGLRPGEKLFEELFHADERASETAIAGIKLARSRAADLAALRAEIDRLEALARAGEAETLLAALRALVPEYRPA